MPLRKLFIVSLVAAIAALIPSGALAQEDDGNDNGFALRINGDLTIAANETISTVWVWSGDAIVEGTVKDILIIINGDGIVSGTVEEDIVVINGTLELGATAVVGGDVNLIRSDLVQDPGATVEGSVHERENVFWWGPIAGLIPIYFWFAMTISLVLAGLVFAAAGGRQLTASAFAISDDTGPTLVAMLVTWIAVPLIAFLAVLTLVGIPFAIALIIALLPTLWMLGYLVSATRLGMWIHGRLRGDVVPGHHPYLAVVIGVVLLQIIGLIPVIGWLIAILAGFVGSGALVWIAWRGWRGPGTTPTQAEPTPAA
jgi:hypothetical protein